MDILPYIHIIGAIFDIRFHEEADSVHRGYDNVRPARRQVLLTQQLFSESC